MRQSTPVGGAAIPLQKVTFSEDALDETEVSERFDLSPSKLRVAQRFGFAESSLGLRSDRRLVRAWTLKQIARVHFAHLLSTHLAMPFQAAIDILLLGEKIGVYMVEPEGLADSVTLRDAVIVLTDRTFISLEFDSDVQALGCLETRLDGRTAFHGDHTVQIPGDCISRCAFYASQARNTFTSMLVTNDA